MKIDHFCAWQLSFHMLPHIKNRLPRSTHGTGIIMGLPFTVSKYTQSKKKKELQKTEKTNQRRTFDWASIHKLNFSLKFIVDGFSGINCRNTFFDKLKWTFLSQHRPQKQQGEALSSRSDECASLSKHSVFYLLAMACRLLQCVSYLHGKLIFVHSFNPLGKTPN